MNRLPRLLTAAALMLAVLIGSASAQDTPPDETGGGLDPVTTPAPLPTREPRPAVFASVSDDRAAFQTYFLGAVPQGQTRLVRVVGNDITAVRANWQNTWVDFWQAADNNFYGLLATHMEDPTGRNQPITVSVTYTDGTRSTLATTLEVTLGAFISQNVNIPANQGYLLDPETERNELARLESLTARVTPERLWDDDGFTMPIPAALTSPFGAFRVFNGALSTRHTGWDIRTTLGISVLAMGGGRVAFSGFLPIRGNYVLVDHGYGVYSGYAHCADVLVERGDAVTRGQTICIAGDTGRTSGPHFHWETAVNGGWVDSVQLLQLWMPE
ncbi:MAG: M23 family metallopeptidase [Pleurocapsa minor GSE-CHR-MK-17-07R]|nr:M23 family metallopeptidase [Pleurocapsa minor GSE-CHR-MK 17-07R]